MTVTPFKLLPEETGERIAADTTAPLHIAIVSNIAVHTRGSFTLAARLYKCGNNTRINKSAANTSDAGTAFIFVKIAIPVTIKTIDVKYTQKNLTGISAEREISPLRNCG